MGAPCTQSCPGGPRFQVGVDFLCVRHLGSPPSPHCLPSHNSPLFETPSPPRLSSPSAPSHPTSVSAVLPFRTRLWVCELTLLGGPGNVSCALSGNISQGRRHIKASWQMDGGKVLAPRHLVSCGQQCPSLGSSSRQRKGQAKSPAPWSLQRAATLNKALASSM